MISKALLGFVEIMIFLTTGLVFWYGRYGINQLYRKRTNVLLSIIMSYIFLIFKYWFNVLEVTIFLLLIFLFFIFKAVWKLPIRGALYCSFFIMIFITIADGVGLTLLCIYDGNVLNETGAIIISKIIQALPIVPLLKYGIVMQNPLLIIKWGDLNKALKNNIIISSLCSFASIFFGYLSIISLSRTGTVTLLNQSYSMVSVGLALMAAYILFVIDKEEEVNSLIVLKSTLYALNKTNNVDYYIDEDLYSVKELSFGPFINLIKVLKKYRGLKCNFFYTYESLVACFDFELPSKKLLVDDSEFKNVKLKLNTEFDIEEVYNKNQVQIQIKERSDTYVN